MRPLTLAVVEVLRFDEVNSDASPLVGERVCVIDVHIDGSTTHTLRIDTGASEMDRQLVAVGECIPLVMMRDAETQPLEVGDRPRYIRDHEDRLDTDDTRHTEIIGRRLPQPAHERGSEAGAGG
jgi:hypothetical protein